MKLTLHARAPEEAADTAEDMFRRALETALWPHSTLATFTPHEVLVTAAEETNPYPAPTPPQSGYSF
jgi:hypothetical protein